jgi:predicted CopG family antitoxin
MVNTNTSIENTKSIHTHTHTETDMGTKNISISEEAYERLAAMKESNESFTEVINRLTKKKSLLELAGVLTGKEREEILGEVAKLRIASKRRVESSVRRVE